MTSDDIRNLLIANDLVNEDVSVGPTGQILAKCPYCQRRKFYICADDDDEKLGVWHCQRCGESGGYAKLLKKLTPLTREQQIDHEFFEWSVRALIENPDALAYLADRDFTEDDIKRFGFGYADESYVAHLEKKYTQEEIEKAGLCRQNGTALFWNHLILPYRRDHEFETFKGRCLDDPEPKMKYISALKRKVGLFQGQNLYKSGRVFFVEGEFKALSLIANGYNAVGLSGAENFGKHIDALNKVEDLWICLDSDENEVGQNAARKLAAQLSSCHLVILPRPDDVEKVGIDDYLKDHSPEEFETLLKTADHYVKGEKQKPRSLSVIVEQWKERAKSLDRPLGFQLGFPRLHEWLGGAQPGSLGYILGSAHLGKTALLRSLAYNLYRYNEDLALDYYSNDDSLAETIPHFVAMIGELNADDCKQPSIAFANDRQRYRDWERATNQLAGMGDRMKILDRSGYRMPIEDIGDELLAWREKNPNGKRALLIDGFDKIFCREATGASDRLAKAVIKSDYLKLIAQQAEVFILCTDQPPKLFGRRPHSYDVGQSSSLEYDATIVITVYQEAHYRGLQNTNIKQIIEYDDGVTVEVPLIEASIAKNKQRGTVDLDLFCLHKNTSTLEELEDTDWRRFKNLVYASEATQKKYGEK